MAKKAEAIPKGLKKAIAQIREKGFTHIKVELEAAMHRSGYGQTCHHCDGEGVQDCRACNAQGYISEARPGRTPRHSECADCEGEGSNDCGDCGGRGVAPGNWTNDEVYDFMRRRWKPETRKAMVHCHAYNDGSVDTEVTYTLPIEDAYLALDVMHSFIALSKKIDNYMGVDNAGMHISVLPRGQYPCELGSLNSDKIANFKKEVTKLLPALYFAAAAKETTRPLEYRMPRIESDNKYSAIFTHGDSCLEYRIFDTCYDNPETLFDYIEVIANTLEFYSDKKLEAGYNKFVFSPEHDGHNTPLDNYFDDLDNLIALEATLPLIKSSKSLRKLKTERGFKLTRIQVATRVAEQQAQYQSQYKSYLAAWAADKAYWVEDMWRESEHGKVKLIPWALRDFEGVEDFTPSWFKTKRGIAQAYELINKPQSLAEYIAEHTRSGRQPLMIIQGAGV